MYRENVVYFQNGMVYSYWNQAHNEFCRVQLQNYHTGWGYSEPIGHACMY